MPAKSPILRTVLSNKLSSAAEAELANDSIYEFTILSDFSRLTVDSGSSDRKMPSSPITASTSTVAIPLTIVRFFDFIQVSLGVGPRQEIDKSRK